MNAAVRRKLDMADRVRVFNRAHPSTDSGMTPLFEQLEERISRAAALAALQRSGLAAARAGTGRRKELRAVLQEALLRHLVRVGEAAAKEQPELAGRFQLPRLGATNRTFVTAARAMLEEAKAHRELLVRLGMTAVLLGELSRQVAEYVAAVDQAASGRQDHVGARADLATVTAEILELVERIDGYQRHRFRDDADMLAAWDSAKNVVGPFRGPVVAPPPALGGTAAAA